MTKVSLSLHQLHKLRSKVHIIKELPYDRTKTTMACFPMCDDCSSEYNDVTDRRYHAQPNACPECGPTLWLCDARGKKLASNDEAIALAKAHLKAGRILAVKGIGGIPLSLRSEKR